MHQIDIEIDSFCGIDQASLSFTGICLVAGKNFAGKTSIARAVQTLLTDRKMPVGDDGKDLAQKQATEVIREGRRTSSASITFGEDRRIIQWFEKEVKADGTLFRISDVSAGLIKPAQLVQKERAALMISLLKGAPDETQFTDAFVKIGASTEQTLEYWKKVQKGSFDIAFTAAEQNGQYLKRKWCEATANKAWGVDMMAKWLIPDEKLAHIEWTPAQHAEHVTKANHQAEQARLAQIARQALTEENKTLAAQLDKHREDVAALRVELKRLNGDKETAYSFMMKAKGEVETPNRLKCPCCNNELALLDGKLALPPKTDKTKEQSKNVFLQHQGAYNSLKDSIDKNQQLLTDAEVGLKRAEQAASTIAKAEQASKAAPGDLQELERLLDEAKRGQAAYILYNSAVSLDQDIRQNEKIKAILAPEGLRRQVLSARLEAFNEEVLGNLCRLADCGTVHLDENMNITYRSRYKFASGAEEFFRDVILQLALAHLADDPIIIIDHDVSLDSNSKMQLFKLLSSPGVRKRCASLVCLVANDRSQVPDLTAKGLGITVWAENGNISHLKQAVAAQ